VSKGNHKSNNMLKKYRLQDTEGNPSSENKNTTFVYMGRRDGKRTLQGEQKLGPFC